MLEHGIERNAGVAQMAFRQSVEAMASASHVEHVGQQHSVVDRGHANAVAQKRETVGFDVVADLEDGSILEQRFHQGQALGERGLSQRRIAAEIESARSRTMPDRHVAGTPRLDGQREADEIGRHGIGGG